MTAESTPKQYRAKGRGTVEALNSEPLTAAPLDPEDAVSLARVLAAMADPVRLRLVSIVASHGEICSCDLEGPLDRSQPTISHHTRILAEAGVLVGEKRGRWMWWQVVPGRFAELRRALGG